MLRGKVKSQSFARLQAHRASESREQRTEFLT
jgi:hypothetical protein